MAGHEAELPPELAEFAAAFRQLSSFANTHVPTHEPEVYARLRRHFDQEPNGLPVVSDTVASFDRPNLQVALEAYLEERAESQETIGLAVVPGQRLGLATFANPKNPWGRAPEPGPIEFIKVRIGEREIACLASALVLISTSEARFAVFTRFDEMHGRQGLQVEVMSQSAEHAAGFITELRELMHRHNVYRGRVLALGQSRFGDTSVVVDDLPEIQRDQIILPGGVLERIERQTIEFTRSADRLRAAGRHLKRGLLLHGPPGTGKTLCAMYLTAQMPGRTTLLLTGQGLGTIAPSCEMARQLQPATVILEDVDLVAMDRQMPGNPNSLLFQLLNEMDGMEPDADVLFVLTTNRPEVLEPALAQRPGRVDEAVELPLPDAEGRLRLLNLYGAELGLEFGSDDPLVAETEGVSAAFIRELLRRAALIATLKGNEGITRDQVTTAFAELGQAQAQLTRRLLGVREAPAPGTARG